jgi:hypothetical protein
MSQIFEVRFGIINDKILLNYFSVSDSSEPGCRTGGAKTKELFVSRFP